MITIIIIYNTMCPTQDNLRLFVNSGRSRQDFRIEEALSCSVDCTNRIHSRFLEFFEAIRMPLKKKIEFEDGNAMATGSRLFGIMRSFNWQLV